MAPSPLRLRHAKGVSTIHVDLDSSTVQDLQQAIFAASEILPSQQDLKIGYPPRSLTLVSELPISSLGLTKGEQIIVSERPGSSNPGVASVPPTSEPVASTLLAASPLSQAVPEESAGADCVETDGGVLVHRIVPDDNSCMFSSVALVFEQDISQAQKVRTIVADGIRSDPETWNDAILGRPVEEYVSVILKPLTWGGAIELSVLASYYNTEIASIDVETGRVDHFSPTTGKDTGNRCILIYSGIHYDAATLAPMAEAPAEWHQTVFPITSPDDSKDPIIIAAKKLADILRSKKAYTNTATFDLKCEVCGQGLKGEKGARAHAAETGHTHFGEY